MRWPRSRAYAAAAALVLCGCGSQGPVVLSDAAPADAPARYFDLAHWRLEPAGGEPVRSELLRAGYRSEDFMANPQTGALVMRCCAPPSVPDASASSDGTWLREMLDPATTNPAEDANTWTVAQGATLHLVVRVDSPAVPTVPGPPGRLVLARVVDANGASILELRFDKRVDEDRGRLYARYATRAAPVELDLLGPDVGGMKIGVPVTLDLLLHGADLNFRVARDHDPPRILAASTGAGTAGLNLHVLVGAAPGPDAAGSLQVSYLALELHHP